MSKINFEEVSLLLGVAKLQPDFPRQPSIFGAALRRLNEIEAEAAEEARVLAEKEAAKHNVSPGQPKDSGAPVREPVRHPEQMRQGLPLHPNTPPLERKA